MFRIMMTLALFIGVLLGSSCTQTQTLHDTLSASTPSQTVNGIEVKHVASYRDGDDVWITLCYQQPNGKNWIPGRHPDDLYITVDGTSYVMSSVDLIGFYSPSDSQTIYRCDRFFFNVPVEPQDGIYHLSLEHLAGDVAKADECPEVQQKLAAENSGIQIECLPDSDGYFSFGIVERPENMTDLEASYVVDNMAGEVISGPWQFSFKVISLGD
jgi:hypothetical protein